MEIMAVSDEDLRSDSADYRRFVDMAKGTIDREIFSSEEIYRRELEQIFARAWNFMCHESQIPKPGDFFCNFIGEESVIATRDKKGQLQVFLNTCRHRGNAVCRAEAGHASSFMCTYHGWTYDLGGNLIGVPGFRDLYHEELDKSQWGLIKAGRVESYKGFVFATMDPDAPPLEEYLGKVGRIGIDMVAARGKIVVIEGVQKVTCGTNWKLAVDNAFDWYHAGLTHASAFMAGYARGKVLPPDQKVPLVDTKRHRVLLGDYGHAISGGRIDDVMLQTDAENMAAGRSMMDIAWRNAPGVREQLGPVGIHTRGHPNIFPNLWIVGGGTQLSLRLPKGPGKTETWWFTIAEETLSEDERRARVVMATHTHGPAGFLEQDDGENWDQSTRGTRGVVARRHPLHFAMGLGHGKIQKIEGGPGYIDTTVNEHAQLWAWRSWVDWMEAANWNALKRDHIQPPTETV
jgi:phenylpropionate dioxygenase-like ring-hydroxylating dioxygenase large terminal subunit